MSKQRKATPLQILVRDHNFRKGRIIAVPKWCTP